MTSACTETRTILVTGCSGLIGSEVVEYSDRQGREVLGEEGIS
jgi:nucleoside-diphosphate-sugar epimerase